MSFVIARADRGPQVPGLVPEWPQALRPASFSKPVANLYLDRWTSRFAIPSMIIGGDFGLLWSNAAADEVLADGKDFQLTSGGFACVDKTQNQAFRSFVAGLGNDPAAWILSRDETSHQMVRAEALCADDLPPAVALMIYAVDADDRFLWSDFHKVFGLTPAETVVVKRIVGGEAAEAIAGELSVALDTVRTHVRRIYAKVGVANREQLFSKISPFRIR